MALGAFRFEAMGFGYDGVTRRVNTQWADVPVAGVLNQQQWLGPTSEEITIRGVIFPAEFGGQVSLEGIIAAALSGLPLLLVSGGALQGLIHGLYAIQSVDEDRSFHTAFGVPRRNAYAISLKKANQTGPLGGLASILNLFA